MPVYATRLRFVHDHPNADRLSCGVANGCPVIFEKDEFKNNSIVGFVTRDHLVSVAREEFSWLLYRSNKDGYHRVRPRRIRGLMSEGIVVPLHGGAVEGENVTERLGVKEWHCRFPASYSFTRESKIAAYIVAAAVILMVVVAWLL